MILKTKALRSLKLFALLISFRVGAEGFNTFDCLRDMMPLTAHGIYQKLRKNVEKPFMVGTKYIVFPEVISRKLSGFYVYDSAGAYFYDTIETRTEEGTTALPIAGLELKPERPLYQMVAQPAGLETVTIYYMPGYNAFESNTNGPVALGTAILPVIGALISRPEQYDYVYESPKDATDNRLHEWMAKENAGRSIASVGAKPIPVDTATIHAVKPRGPTIHAVRRPASVTQSQTQAQAQAAPAPAPVPKIERKMVSLVTRRKLDDKAMWQPLKDELRLRREWTKSHNIDNRTFKSLSRILETTCKAG